jgi:short-subunit dehydrogenase/acyl dehydratase/acyl carrier protein
MAEDPQVGDVVIFKRTFGSQDFHTFAALSGDHNPLHHDPDYAARTAMGVPIVPAVLAASPFSAAAGMALPGHRSLILSAEIRALEPIRYDEEVVYSFRVVNTSKEIRTLDIRALALQGKHVALEGHLRVRIRDDVAADDGPDQAWGTYHRASGPRRALVTGAAGAIGAACARVLASRGWHLMLQCRSNDARMARIAKEISGPIDVEVITGDLTDPSARAALAAASVQKPIAAVVHAASPQIDAPASALHEVNYVALRTLVDSVLPNMLERQDGAFVMIGSEAVRTTPPGWDDYTAAKAAASSYAEAVGRRHGAHGISSTVVHPSYVATNFSSSYRTAGVAVLLAEEVAELVGDVLSVDTPDGAAQLWMKPGKVDRGSAETAVAASSDGRVTRPEKPEVESHSNGDASADRVAHEVERVARTVLRLAPAADMAGAGLGRTENWTSLAQIEILLALEERFGVEFTSVDLSSTPSLSELQALVREKLAKSVL